MKLYTIKELTEVLKTTRQTIYVYIKTGKLEASNISKSTIPAWRISEDALKNFLNKK